MFGNIHNWKAIARLGAVFASPGVVAKAILTGEALASVVVKTPVGDTRIHLRNFESLKTVFSVFCRRDYPVDGAVAHDFIDIGANVGVAAMLFLTRNPGNRVRCYEPDRDNLAVLRRNLAAFGDRAELVEKAVAVDAGTATLFRSEDGKYTSLLETGDHVDTDTVEMLAFSDVLDRAEREARGDIVLKIDIEGLEPALVRSVDFASYPRLSRLIVESLECSRLIARRHERRVRSGYVEDLLFR